MKVLLSELPLGLASRWDISPSPGDRLPGEARYWGYLIFQGVTAEEAETPLVVSLCLSVKYEARLQTTG